MKKTILALTLSLLLTVTMINAQTHKGLIIGNIVTYKSSTEITITPGSGRCSDTFWETTADTDLNLSSVIPGTEDFVYIYVDDSASSYPTPTFIGSTTEPTWTATSTNVGWYNGDDRCIGVVWFNSYGTIVEFQNNSSCEYIAIDDVIKTPLQNGNPNSTFQTLETTAYIPVNATAIYLVGRNSDSSSTVQAQVAPYENTQTSVAALGYNCTVKAVGWIPIARGFSRDLQWFGLDDDDNNFTIEIFGFRYDR